jgi:hypothetical protein
MKPEKRIGKKDHSLKAGGEFWLFLCRIIVIGLMLFVQSSDGVSVVKAADTISFTGAELLGCPTDSSIVINIIPNSAIEYYYEYGTSSGSYTQQTGYFTAVANDVSEIEITGLAANTEYFYRMRYHAPGDAMDDWVIRDEHSFWTQRAEGSPFVFTITSDIHGQSGGSTNFGRALANIVSDDPDFNMDLGDTFMVDAASSQTVVDNAYLAFRANNSLGAIGVTSPIFLASGNHEEEEGWNLDDTPFSAGVGSIQARKMYYPTPIEGDFYTGNTDPLGYIDEVTYGDELREDYYAWEWGDALFVVIDPFQYTMTLPYTPAAGEENDESVIDTDQWNWTLGAQQFNWLKNVLQSSDAKYKFVFAHQPVGGIPNLVVSGVGPGYVRGGAEAAAYFEWGGLNDDDTPGFADNRSEAEFGTMPIHQMFVEYGVSAFFHGHDHQYVYERRDDVVYQEMPSAGGMMGFSGIYFKGVYDDFETIDIVASPGYLRLSVSPEETLVEYVSSASGTNGNVVASYIIEPNDYEPPEDILGDVNHDGLANSTDALIVLKGDVGLDISTHCPVNCGDVNNDGYVNSTDALLILKYDVGLTITQPVGEPGCYESVTQPPGCSPP